MADNRLRCTSSSPEGCNKRFEKTRSRMVHHAIKGALGMLPQQALIFDHDIGNHCLPF